MLLLTTRMSAAGPSWSARRLTGRKQPIQDGLVECDRVLRAASGPWETGEHTAPASTTPTTTEQEVQVYTTPPTLPTTDTDAHTRTPTSSAPLRAAPSQWITLDSGVEYDVCKYDTEAHKNKRCRTYEVERAAAHLVTPVLTLTLMFSARLMAAPSLLTVLELGTSTTSASTMLRDTRTRGAGCTRSAQRCSQRIRLPI